MIRFFSAGRPSPGRATLAAALGGSLLAALVTAPQPSSAAPGDPHVLRHRHAQLDRRIHSSASAVDGISHRLLRAKARLTAAAVDLQQARVTLGGLQEQVQSAALEADQLQKALDAAQARLEQAKADVGNGQRAVARERSSLAAYAVSNSATVGGQLSTLGLLFNSGSTHSVLAQVQGTNSAVAAQLTALQRLQAHQVLLRLARERATTAARQVAAARRQAAAQLATAQQLAANAADAAATVAHRVSDLRDQRQALSAAKQSELREIAAMRKEQAQVEARLHAIAVARARAAARRAAREAARQAARQSASSAGATATPGTPPSDGGYLSWPIPNSYVTSPYGMRMNPVVHVYELHDGTDFHAACGSPVYAAAPGRVSQEYYSSVYGNRLFIDHGWVRGVSLSTSYNHLTSYVASVGQRVARGQLVAYSGTTGWSTGCHLHFSVYVNGSTVDPLTWL